MALVVLLAACSSSTNGTGTKTGDQTTASGSSASQSSSSSAAPKAKSAVNVHVSLNIGDGGTVGVGMPIIATFKQKITDGRAFQDATKVTVNGEETEARWYFEYSDPASGHLMEAHLRPQHYWPAHAEIHVDLPVKGESAGGVPKHPLQEYRFDNSLTLDFSTGAANIVTVDDSTHTLTVTSDGKPWGKTFPVSLGANNTPTSRGIKVIMEKGRSICMSGPGYHECGVKYTQRLTYGGEYLHAAPWNLGNLGRFDSSNGCTNLSTTDAKTLYDFLGVGDVVQYPNANGPKMQLGQGYGDWNVSWGLWQTGGAIPTS
ncbi:MAG TPA: L,D-transpeptidase [Jatrophihabitantaceae bacterium]|nr:L,D-transpeptidase [Jatrophihabitantaceae bacterium]